MKRVEVPAYTDRWMMGDRFGVITKVSRQRPEIAHVLLDKSGKTIRVILDDCREI